MYDKSLEKKLSDINKQYNFCVLLMDHFADDIERKYKEGKCGSNYYQHQFDGRHQLVGDIIRIRREFNVLRKMIEKTGYEGLE